MAAIATCWTTSTPYLYLTNDYGKTWKRIADGTNGIPAGHFTRVVREDPDRPGLLYAGTEHGMYISFDDGAHWQPFQLNLPRTPIMDLKVYRKNLIVATEGRAFWISTTLPVVQQAQGRARADEAACCSSRRRSPTRTAQGGPLPTFYYWFKEQPTAPVTVEVKDAAGTVVYTATAQPGTRRASPPSPVPTAAPAAGGRAADGGGAAAVAVAAAVAAAGLAAARRRRARPSARVRD